MLISPFSTILAFVSITSDVIPPTDKCCKDPEHAEDTPLVDVDVWQASVVSTAVLSKLILPSDTISPLIFNFSPPVF